MTNLFALLALALVTVVAIRLQLKRAARNACRQPPCPRCSAPIIDGAQFCPECGVPQQIFEITRAPIVSSEEPEPGTDGDRLHAVVRADVCVGCGSCVPVCPEAGAIRLEGKLAVVEKDLCTGHSKCVEACPVGGILLTTGGTVHRVEVPEVRSDFQSNVDGVYVVGELGGRGLIKNAINEGKIAAENVVRDTAASSRTSDVLDAVIVGSGPAGLSAGLAIHRAGLRYLILEQGSLADSIRKYPRRKLLLAEPVKVPLFGDLWVADASKETLLQMWEAIIHKEGLRVRTGSRVSAIVRDGEALLVSGEGFECRARRVILALGRRGTPRRLGVPGEDTDKVFYDVVEMETFRGRRVLVVGGGDSALESAVGLANQPDTEVTLSYRGDSFEKAKERNVQKLDDAEKGGRLRVLRGSQVRSIAPAEVTISLSDGRTAAFPNDDVVVRIGGEPPTSFLSRVGIRSVTKEIPLADAKESVGA